jgi:hypothetical protein
VRSERDGDERRAEARDAEDERAEERDRREDDERPVLGEQLPDQSFTDGFNA